MKQIMFKAELEAEAEKGDLASLCRLMEARLTPMMLANSKEEQVVAFNHLFRRTIINAGIKDSPALTKHLLLEILSIQCLLMYRIGTHTSREIDQADRMTNVGYGNLPYDIMTDYLPRLSKLQEEVKQTLKAIASLDKKKPKPHVPQEGKC